MAKIKKPSKKKSQKIKPQLTRKEQRKQRTLQKKENKRLFFSKKLGSEESPKSSAKKLSTVSSTNVLNGKRPKPLKKTAPETLDVEKLLSGEFDGDDDESIASDFVNEEVEAKLNVKKPNAEQQPNAASAPKRVKVQQTRPNVEEQHRRDIQRQQDLEKASRKQRIKTLHLQNEEEDIEIARLEKKLKLNRSKDKNRLVRKMFNDGLDYALEMCLDDEEERAKLELKEKRKKAQADEFDWSDENEDGAEGEAEHDDDSRSIDDDISVANATDDDNDDEISEAGDHENQETAVKEDIYGRKRDKAGNIIEEENVADEASLPQKYMPPHMRAKLLASQGADGADDRAKQAQLLERVRKQCKGLLNRLSEANLHKIAVGIEELYMRNSRNNMNETLTKLLNEALITRTNTKDRMVQEHMVLVAYLHAHIGSEIGAHFLQCYVEQFSAFLNDDISNLPIEDKRLNNIVLLLSYMYIFKIFEHRLLIELIDKLTLNLCEKTVECLLLIFQSVGFKLRKDDPVAFKLMTNTVQQRIAAAPLELKENSRLKFMVETLNAVKNNNSKKIPQFDPELGENLRKSLKAMLRNDKYVTTLNITMEDLLRADQVGKWWVVGSAWSGKINDLAAAQKQQGDETKSGKQFSEHLLKLAKQQKMNTEERRSIFCIIMSAEDYMDAFEQILHLSLKDQRATAYVIIRCCLNEARPNPYYAHLAVKFCNHNRKYQLAFTFASYDCINEIESLNKQQIKNFGQFLQNVILNGGLQLAVLKAVDFVQLQKSSFLLMREVMVGLLLHQNERELHAVFERIAKNPKVQQFKNSLRLFMQHFLLKQDASKLKLTEEKFALLTKRIEYLDNLLAQVDL